MEFILKENNREDEEKIAIIGTGNYGISLGKRLMKYGYNVIYGSRMPNLKYLNECFSSYDFTQDKYSVARMADAFYSSDLYVFLAISSDDYESFIREIIKYTTDQLSQNKQITKDIILIELSNSTSTKQTESNAQRLDNLIKLNLNFNGLNISLIKGFNLVDAYSISLVIDQKGSNEISVPICGDDSKSKILVSKLCSKINIKTNDIGKLKYNSLYLERLNNETFTEWKLPSLICILYLIFNFIWMFIHYYVFSKKNQESFYKYTIKTSLLGHLNKVLGLSSLQLLALVYLSSVFASIYQLTYKTKYKRFPNWLDFLLRSRKQFGLWAFLYATLHIICSIVIADPAYLSGWYNKAKIIIDSDHNDTYEIVFPKLTLHGELNFLSGIFAYVLMLLVALSSINSIANSFNWNEWRFVQTKLGITCLFVATSHAFIMYSKTIFERDQYSLLVILTRFKLLACILPLMTLILRFLFGYFPPLSKRIEAIRKGKIYRKNSNDFNELLPLTN